MSASLVGGMLKRLSDGQALDNQRIVTPVEFRQPSAGPAVPADSTECEFSSSSSFT